MVVEKNVRITEHFFDNRYIWKEQLVLDFVGAASSRDRFNSRLDAAPTEVFF